MALPKPSPAPPLEDDSSVRTLTPQQGFSKPVKRINESSDMAFWLQSEAYARLIDLIGRISKAVSNKKIPQKLGDDDKVNILIGHLQELEQWIEEIPPQTGPRRFGNIAFRDWHSRLDSKVQQGLLSDIVEPGPDDSLVELNAYFIASFGSEQRLDYGTGHELAFLAFVGGLYQLGLLKEITGGDWLLIFKRYLNLIQKLVKVYNLEPAGSHGVWGLDDHFHLPYIFGSAQMVDITENDRPTKPSPKVVLQKDITADLSAENLYMSAIDFIYQVKRGPFYEHSPTLYDISGVATWHKIHRGMIKMYIAEVLGKFPVAQHFLFGTVLYPWTPHLAI